MRPLFIYLFQFSECPEAAAAGHKAERLLPVVEAVEHTAEQLLPVVEAVEHKAPVVEEEEYESALETEMKDNKQHSNLRVDHGDVGNLQLVAVVAAVVVILQKNTN